MSNGNFLNRVYTEESLELDLRSRRNIAKYEIHLLLILKYINCFVVRVSYDQFNTIKFECRAIDSIRLNSSFDFDYLNEKSTARNLSSSIHGSKGKLPNMMYRFVVRVSYDPFDTIKLEFWLRLFQWKKRTAFFLLEKDFLGRTHIPGKENVLRKSSFLWSNAFWE